MPTFTSTLRALSLAGAVLFAATGCGGGGGGGDTPRPPDPVSTGTVSGRVADAQTGEAIAGVEVKIGALKATSDANGRYSVPAVPLGSTVVAEFSKATYASNFATFEVIKDKNTTADRRLGKVAVTQNVSATTGGTVTLAGSTAQVQLPAAGIVTAAGTAYTGTVSVAMTPIDPRKDPLNMPGNFRAQGEAVPIESFGALQVELRDGAGAMLNLAPGKTATLRIPVPKGSASPPQSIPLYYFKESTGLWVREGLATLTGNVPDQYYQGTVSHFSTWNADRPLDTIYIHGCVVNAANQPVNATVESEGIDYSGSATVAAGADGKFSVPARRNSEVQVSAFNGLDRDSVVVKTGSTDVTLSTCLVLSQKPPVIVTQPVNLTIAPGALNTLTVVANNADQYKWYRNGQLIDSGSRHLYLYGSASAAGSYYVVVSNPNGSVTSTTVTVTVAEPVVAPVIVTPPQNVSVVAGTQPVFSVLAIGPSLSYQWLRNGAEIIAAQSATLTLGPVTALDNGALISVRVRNAAGTVISTNAVLTVTAEAVAPAITSQPGNTSVQVGQNASFGVGASGTSPFTYQWLRNGTEIAGATGAVFQTAPTTLADNATRYSVRVTNAKGSVTSAEATLTVSANTSIAGLYLPFASGTQVNGEFGYAAIPAAGGPAVPFWPAGAGKLAGQLFQAQVSNGQARNLHTRSMLFWQNQQLVRRDLVGVNGLPAAVRVSSMTTANLCAETNDESTIEGQDWSNASLSWLVYQQRGTDDICGTDDDRYVAVRANMAANESPKEVLLPVTSIHGSNGALTGWLIRNGQLMQRVNADFTNPVTLFTLPSLDLDSDDETTSQNVWVFESGNRVYAVNLSAPAPAALTTVAVLANGEYVISKTYANNADVVLAIAGNNTTRIVRLVSTTMSVNQVTTVSGLTSANTVTPTRVVVNGPQGKLFSAPLTGGTAQLIYTASNAGYAYVAQRGGERLWLVNGDGLASFNSDGSGVLTLPGAQLSGCIGKEVLQIDDALEGCDAVMVLQGNVVRAYDATSGAVRLTYGTITIPNAPLTNLVYFDFLTSWGQTGVLSQYIYNPEQSSTQTAVGYRIKTDQAGVTLIALP
jgi:hypothetical protein